MALTFIQKNLWMGDLKTIHQPATVYDRGIRAVLRLDTVTASEWLDHFEVYHLPFSSELAIFPKQIRDGLLFMVKHILAGRGVLVQGRTGETIESIFVLAYLIQQRGWDLADAFTYLLLRQPHIMPPPAPMQTLAETYEATPLTQDLNLLLSLSQSRIHAITDQIFLGSLSALQRESELQSQGISAIVRLDRIPRQRGQWSDQFEVLDIPLADRMPLPLEKVREVTAFIANKVQNGQKVFIHCQMGASRSPTLLIAYLIEYGGLSLAQAYTKVSQRPIVQPAPIMVKSIIELYNLPYDPEAVFDPEFWDDLLAEGD